MKKFIVTEQERHQILNLYKEKRLIIEQSSKVAYNTTHKSDDRSVGFNFFTTNERAKGKITYVGSEYYNETLANRKLVDGKIPKEDTSSRETWETILQKEQIFAANTIEYTRKNTWIEVITFRDKIDSEEDKDKPLEELNDGMEITINKENLTDFYFVNNLSELTDEGKRDITTNMIQPFVEGKGNRDACIDLLQVDSSASRYRNTESAKDKSFLQLSTERNNAVKTYILEQLNTNGFNKWCKVSENIIQNPKGSNGDGTSGPNAPSPTPFIIKGQEKMEPPSSDESKRNEFGEPHPRPEDYDKYKYSIPRVRVGFNEITPPTQEKVPAVPDPRSKTRYVAEFKGNVGEYVPNDKNKKGGGSSTTVRKPIRGEVKNIKMSCPVFRENNKLGM
jgi:hypothetical protein